MKLLAFDTSTEACTAALWLDGQTLEHTELRSQHSEHLLAMIDALLAEAGMALTQLDAIAFGRGPGSFTGLRIGAGVAQGLALATDLPVVPVSSLASLAQGAPADRILTALDARMQQVYWGVYQRGASGRVELVGDEMVISPAAVPMPEGPGWVGAGPGWQAYARSLQERLGKAVTGVLPEAVPQARDVALLGIAGLAAGRGIAADQASPTYVRDEVAIKSSARSSR